MRELLSNNSRFVGKLYEDKSLALLKEDNGPSLDYKEGKRRPQKAPHELKDWNIFGVHFSAYVMKSLICFGNLLIYYLISFPGWCSAYQLRRSYIRPRQ